MISTRVGSGTDMEAREEGSCWLAVVLRLSDVADGLKGKIGVGAGRIGLRGGAGALVDGVKALSESMRASRRSLWVVRR